MINVRIQYDPDVVTSPGDKDELSQYTEATVGQIFAEELRHVDVELEPYDSADVHDHDLFFTIDVEDEDLHRQVSEFSELLLADLNQHFREWFCSGWQSHAAGHFHIGLWIRPIHGGEFVEA